MIFHLANWRQWKGSTLTKSFLKILKLLTQIRMEVNNKYQNVENNFIIKGVCVQQLTGQFINQLRQSGFPATVSKNKLFKKNSNLLRFLQF